MSKIPSQIVAKIAIEPAEWDALYQSNPEMSQALVYLLLVEEYGGLGAAFEARSTSEVNAQVAQAMGITVTTLTAKRREWSKNQTLADARAWLQPLRLEQLQIMADRVQDNFMQIMGEFLKTALDPKTDVYGRMAAYKMLKSEVLQPALSNQKAEDDGAGDYLEQAKRAEQVQYDISEDEDAAAKYLAANGGEG